VGSEKFGQGDVFKLAQLLDPSLNFGQVRRDLRQLVGLGPSYPPADRQIEERAPRQPPELRCTVHKPVTAGSATWSYLVRERGLTPEIVEAAARANILREGTYASAWFAHRDGDGVLTGIEMRGPNYRGISRPMATKARSGFDWAPSCRPGLPSSRRRSPDLNHARL